MNPQFIINENTRPVSIEEKRARLHNEVDKILTQNADQNFLSQTSELNIHDLTRGKFPDLYYPADCSFYARHVEGMSHLNDKFQSLFVQPSIDIYKVLSNIPIYLVESSMADEYVAVPGCQCSVRVPVDKSYSLSDNFNIDDWVNSKEGDKDDPRERTSKRFTITDLLGVYIYSGERDLIPRRIFIWMDKIMDYAENNKRSNDDIKKNAQKLFDMVLYHEMAHALMDVELYGILPAPNFSYTDDYPYRFIEEAYANGIALTILMDKGSHKCSPLEEERFIDRFVKSQAGGYAYGWELYHYGINNDALCRWMGIKVLFNYKIAILLRDFWYSIALPLQKR